MDGVRIIAGELKGRRLRVPRGTEVRPTPARAREALFSILADQITGAVVLDAFAGTGALGFESLSRGARRVLFLEGEARVARALEDNAIRLGVSDRCEVRQGEVLDRIDRLPAGHFDLILADPPYAGETGPRFLRRIARADALAPSGVLVMEREAPSGVEPVDGLELLREERYGRTVLRFYGRASSG